MEVYENTCREKSVTYPIGTVVGARTVAHNMEPCAQPQVRSRPFAQEIASGERRDDLFSDHTAIGRHSSTSFKEGEAEQSHDRIMFVVVKGTFLYGTRRHAYTKLFEEGEMAKERNWMG